MSGEWLPRVGMPIRLLGSWSRFAIAVAAPASSEPWPSHTEAHTTPPFSPPGGNPRDASLGPPEGATSESVPCLCEHGSDAFADKEGGRKGVRPLLPG